VLRTKVARWCCISSGNAVIALEEIPAKQFRNSEHIRGQVGRALACLREAPNG
jgi:hypothetical protein